jgi:hypothetical protein
MARPVVLDAVWRAHVIDRIEHVEEFHGFVAEPEPAQRDHRPQRRVRVLPAVLANAGQIPLDVPRIVRHAVERWRQEEHQLRIPPHQVSPHGLHGAGRPLWIRFS